MHLRIVRHQRGEILVHQRGHAGAVAMLNGRGRNAGKRYERNELFH